MTKIYTYLSLQLTMLLLIVFTTMTPITLPSVAQTDASAPVSVADDGNRGATNLELMPPF